VNKLKLYTENILFGLNALILVALLTLILGHIAAFLFEAGNKLVALSVPWGIFLHGVTRVIFAVCCVAFMLGMLTRTWPSVYSANLGITTTGWVFFNYVAAYPAYLMFILAAVSVAAAYLTIRFNFYRSKLLAAALLLSAFILPDAYYVALCYGAYLIGIAVLSSWHLMTSGSQGQNAVNQNI
jgi:hypothetical protein